MKNLTVGNKKEVLAVVTGVGYVTIEGEEYFALGSDDLPNDISDTPNEFDCYYMTKDESKIFKGMNYWYDEDDDFDTPFHVIVQRIK